MSNGAQYIIACNLQVIVLILVALTSYHFCKCNHHKLKHGYKEERNKKKQKTACCF